MGRPALSLLICTRDRAEQLARCLSALPTEDIRAVGAEVVLVDNASSDATPDVLRAFARDAAYPVRVLREETPGRSFALNAGVAAAQGDLIAFSDDDCYLGPGYLRTALSEFSRGTFQYAGGRILLHDPSDARIAVNYSRRCRMFPPGSFLRPGVIQGANMIVTRKVLEKAGRFDEEMGAGSRFRCEDIDLLGRASMAGFTGAFIPALVVYHHHGRKPGAGTDALHRANAHGRGAYYAKFILNGHLKYLLGWAWRSAAPWRMARIPDEIRGAREYARSRPPRG